MTPQELRERTRQFALRVREMCKPHWRNRELVDAVKQFVRASASVASNYRAAGVARSRKGFSAKLSLVLEEADECVYWSGYFRDIGITSRDLPGIGDEARQLARIFSASVRTATANAEAEEAARKRKRRQGRRKSSAPDDQMTG